MRLDELPRSDKVEDRRATGRAAFRCGRTGGLGIGTIVLLGLLGWALGINPLYLIGGAEICPAWAARSSRPQPAPGSAKTGAPPIRWASSCAAVLGSTEVQWKEIFAAAGKTYRLPTLVMFSGATRSACGFAQSAMGPFYCPNDQQGLSRHLVLSGFRAAFPRLRGRQQGLPVLPGLCDHPRDRPSRAEPARHPAAGAGAAARHGPGRGQSSCRCGSSCRPTALPGCGRTTRRRNGG